ncbi:hypothetical protein HQ531_14185 [bacterium]|nr:hypothetical protein [bacterium]
MLIKNTKVILTAALILLLVCSVALGRNKIENLNKPAGDPGLNVKLVHKVGKVWTAVTNFGIFGDADAPALPSMEWPGGTGVHYLWEGRLWVAADVDGEKRSSHADYGNYELAGIAEWPLTLGSGKSVEDSYAVYDDLNNDIQSTESLGLQFRQRGLTWSTKDFDDFVIYEFEVERVEDGDGYSGGPLNDFYMSWCYDSDVGIEADPTSPHIDDLVDYDGWDGNNPAGQISYTVDVVHNVDWDMDGVMETMEGYDDRGVPVAWHNIGSPSLPNPNWDEHGAQPDGFYDEYQVWLVEDGPVITWQTSVSFNYNGSVVTTVAGEPAVLDGETLTGYVFSRNMSYMYDGDDPATPEFDTFQNGVVPGVIGGRLIYTDYYKMYGAYGETEDDTYMRAYTHSWWNWESDPGTDKNKYEYMSGTHPASAGHKFMPHPFAIGAPTFDYRWLTATGPFYNFAKGDVLEFVYVGLVGHGLAGARTNSDNSVIAYYTGSAGNPYNPTSPSEDVHYLLPVPPPVPVLKYSPMNLGVRLAWDNSAEITPDPLLLVPDFEGYRVYRSAFTPSNWELLAIFDNTDEYRYIVDFETGDTLTDESGEPYFVNLAPYNSGVPSEVIPHFFEDQGGAMMALNEAGEEITIWTNEAPKNDLPYYYSVTAYDNPSAFGRPEFPSIESSRVNFATSESGAPEPLMPEGLYEEGDDGPDELDVNVYPNPYLGANRLEKKYESKITFIGLPPDCRINIFGLGGDLIDIIIHDDGSTNESWDMVSRNNQEIATGLFVYTVETSDGRRQMGKFVVLRGI